MRVLLLASLVSAAGCVHLAPNQPLTGIPGVVRITVKTIKSDMVKLDVANESNESLLVERDAIVLRESSGTRARMSGGAGSHYVVPPGGHHAVNLRYDIAGLRAGEAVFLDFSNAIVMGATPLPVTPLQVAVE